MGLDARNSQIFCRGIINLQKFKGKITFWGEIDRQYVLPSGSLKDVINAVKEVKELLYSNGGVIAQCELGPGAKLENVYCVFETWESFV